MTMQLPQPVSPAAIRLRWAALLFLAGWGVHVVDHLRRGMAASPHAIMVGGTIQGAFVLLAVFMAITGRSPAAESAIVVGFGSAALFVYAHLLPNFFPAYQDSFVSGPRINVTWFSWVSAVTEIGTGIAFAATAILARSNANDSKAVHP